MQLLLTPDSTACADALYWQLTTELQAGKNVLWFLTGGSNIALDIAVMSRLDNTLTNNLIITLTDERFGDYGHSDSNWQQLVNAGLDQKHARAIEVLQRDKQSLSQTTDIFISNLEVALAEADAVIGFYGMGSDGHIAGILPSSEAIEATGPATGYETENFTRITTTFDMIRQCDVAFVYASGNNKLSALQNLSQSLSLNEQPAQILKQLPEAFIYNDQIGD